MHICEIMHIAAVAQKGYQEGVSILPDTLPAQEQNIDQDERSAKREAPPGITRGTPCEGNYLKNREKLPYLVKGICRPEFFARARYTPCENGNED